MVQVKVEWQPMVPEAKFKEAKEELRRLIEFCTSGRRYEQKNPYLIEEIRRAIKWLYAEEFPVTMGHPVTELNTPERCGKCDTELVHQVLKSAAGFYIGTRCKCGPYSRDSGYYNLEIEAIEALEEGGYGR